MNVNCETQKIVGTHLSKKREQNCQTCNIFTAVGIVCMLNESNAARSAQNILWYKLRRHVSAPKIFSRDFCGKNYLNVAGAQTLYFLTEYRYK